MSTTAKPLVLFAHPFSSYCQKALLALYENQTSFQYRSLEEPANMQELARRWPMKRFPLLVDGEQTVLEASIIIEHLQLYHPGPVRLLPDDPRQALQVRMLDRFFDNYIATPQQKIVFDGIRPPASRDPHGVDEARRMLDTAYAWLDQYMSQRQLAGGDAFSLADCAAAPFLFYADWTHRIPAQHTHVHAYRRRLLARPSMQRVVDEARPYRHLFPLGAPDRD
ncbi:glutathione S-transferase family protein [Pseudoxanthomonas dokdonensis]|uniref:Glutathione S-transferase n=1 Tax=Pseudoxanthomonas dokdonensis TaxID=344882 RepID=A0A0R0CX71_9GAMM|nr:glutathione S-transferase family protein [Pseudoxanthomonas dokdonensis]KRG70986.1 glutathione S-transferase [Pseudoxanthomonas dokdonensis]